MNVSALAVSRPEFHKDKDESSAVPQNHCSSVQSVEDDVAPPHSMNCKTL